MAACRRLGVGMGVALLAATLCPISYAEEAQATGQGATIGVTVEKLSDAQRERMDYTADGVLITAVDPDGAAGKGGLVAGDILVVVGSTSMRRVSDLAKAEAKLQAGADVAVVIARNGGRLIKVMNLEVPLAPVPILGAELPTELDEESVPPAPGDAAESIVPAPVAEPVPAPASEAVPAKDATPAPTAVAVPEAAKSETPLASLLQAAAPPASVVESMGLEGQDLDSDLASALGTRVEAGVVVLRVKPNSAAAAAGIKPGDVLTQLGDEKLRGVDHLGETLGRLGPSAALRIQRQGDEREVRLAPEPPPAPAAAETTVEPSSEDRSVVIDELRAEVESLRSQVRRLRSELARLRDREADTR